MASANKGKDGIFVQIAVAVVIALLVGGSAPWWWNKVFPVHPNTEDSSLQMLDFNYRDSPIKHGWVFTDGIDAPQVAFNPVYEGQNIKGMEASSQIRWGMDIELEPDAKQFGKVLKFAIVPGKDAAIYTFINISRSDGANSTGWLKFMSCNDDVQPIVIDSPGNNEWQVCLTPISHDGDWLVFKATLIDAVKRTFSADGWSFQNINKVRVRGNLSLDYISVQEK